MLGAGLKQESVLSVDHVALPMDADPPSRPVRSLVVGAVLFVVFLLAFLLRVIDLNNLPGFNGDEAWYGVQIERFQASLPVVVQAPSGRLSTNIFLAAVLAPIQVVVGPAIWVLRVPAVIAGVLTVWLAFVGLRSVWGRGAALSTAVILACLPINIAYSRFGWDPSLLGPFIVVAIAAAGRGRWLAAVLAVVAAIVVHPTAVLTLPLIWGLVLGAGRAPAGWWGRLAPLRWGGFALASAGLVVLSRVLADTNHATGQGISVARITDLDHAWKFTSTLFSLFSGRSVHNYFVSTGVISKPWLILERGALTVTLIVVVTGLLVALAHRVWRDVGLLVGTSVSAVLLYLSLAAPVVLPEYGRYAVFIVPPAVLCFVVAMKHSVWLVATRYSRSRPDAETGAAEVGPGPATISTLALGIALLAVTITAYFQPLRDHGSATHEAFLTAKVDPKQQVWEIISAHPGAGRSTVYCPDWWLCYPLVYFAGAGDSASSIVSFEADPRWLFKARANDWVAVRTGSAADVMLRERLRTMPGSAEARSPGPWLVVDLSGRPAYTVFRL